MASQPVTRPPGPMHHPAPSADLQDPFPSGQIDIWEHATLPAIQQDPDPTPTAVPADLQPLTPQQVSGQELGSALCVRMQELEHEQRGRSAGLAARFDTFVTVSDEDLLRLTKRRPQPMHNATRRQTLAAIADAQGGQQHKSLSDVDLLSLDPRSPLSKPARKQRRAVRTKQRVWKHQAASLSTLSPSPTQVAKAVRASLRQSRASPPSSLASPVHSPARQSRTRTPSPPSLAPTVEPAASPAAQPDSPCPVFPPPELAELASSTLDCACKVSSRPLSEEEMLQDMEGLSGFAAYRYLDEPDSEGCRDFRVFTEAELQEAQGFFSPDREDADSKWAAHSHSPGAAISEEQSVLDDFYADFFADLEFEQGALQHQPQTPAPL
ncbi:MAG: hypothetical protein WDW38_003918 [Sanguina aurantia]